MIIDTHCHLEDDIETSNLVKKMKNDIIIVSGYDNESNKTVIELCNKYDNIYGTIGIHPEEVNNYKEEDINYIIDNLNNKKIVGIGEIGLDYHYDLPKEEQKNLFIKQLNLARQYKLPVVIHSRDSILDTYEIIKEYKDIKKILHCYSGSLESAKEFIKINTFIGVGGVITFKNSKTLVNVVSNIDLKYIVLETDSPYLTPEPFRGTKNSPNNVKLVAEKVAEIKNISYEEITKITSLNAKGIFDLKI